MRCWRACAVRCGRCCGLRALQGGLQHCRRIVECLRLLAVMMLNVQVLKLLFPVRVQFTSPVSASLKDTMNLVVCSKCSLASSRPPWCFWVALAVPCRAIAPFCSRQLPPHTRKHALPLNVELRGPSPQRDLLLISAARVVTRRLLSLLHSSHPNSTFCASAACPLLSKLDNPPTPAIPLRPPQNPPLHGLAKRPSATIGAAPGLHLLCRATGEGISLNMCDPSASADATVPSCPLHY